MLTEWPNATCPLCGAAVWFWRNDAGSKVYFDAVGAPWPKHPCMDFSTAGPTSSSSPRGQSSTTATATTGSTPAAGAGAQSGPGCGLMMLWLVAVFAAACVANDWRLFANGDPNFETPTAPIIGTALSVMLVRAARRKSRRV